jgi:hypothetical protein
MPVDEVLINARRYRIPERVIILDFWGKINEVDVVNKVQTSLEDARFADQLAVPFPSLTEVYQKRTRTVLSDFVPFDFS